MNISGNNDELILLNEGIGPILSLHIRLCKCISFFKLSAEISCSSLKTQNFASEKIILNILKRHTSFFHDGASNLGKSCI